MTSHDHMTHVTSLPPGRPEPPSQASAALGSTRGGGLPSAGSHPAYGLLRVVWGIRHLWYLGLWLVFPPRASPLWHRRLVSYFGVPSLVEHEAALGMKHLGEEAEALLLRYLEEFYTVQPDAATQQSQPSMLFWTGAEPDPSIPLTADFKRKYIQTDSPGTTPGGLHPAWGGPFCSSQGTLLSSYPREAVTRLPTVSQSVLRWRQTLDAHEFIITLN